MSWDFGTNIFEIFRKLCFKCKTLQKQLDVGKWNYRALMVRMSAWSTNPDYADIILQAIVDNKLP